MEDKQYVGFWNRFHAVLVTTILLSLIEMLVSYLVLWDDFLMVDIEFLSLHDILVSHLLPLILTILIWIKYASDPGKMLYKAKIVDATTYEKPTIKQYIIRYVGYYISLLPLGLGYFWVIWDRKKQSWHDKLAHTVVIKPAQDEKIKWYMTVYRLLMSLLIVFVIIAFIMSAFIAYEKNCKKVNALSPEQLIRLSQLDMHSVVYYAEASSLVDEWIKDKYEIKTIDKDAICTMILEDKKTTKKSCHRFKDIKKLDIEFDGDEDNITVLLYDAAVYSPYEDIGDGVSEGLFEYGIIDSADKSDFNTTVMGLWKRTHALNRNTK